MSQVVKRVDALDSLRGLAALSVVFHHCLLALPLFYAIDYGLVSDVPLTARLLSYTPLHLLWSGTEAVILFFILSGYVLALPFTKGNPPAPFAFVIKRACRICLPYLFTIAASAILYARLLPAKVPQASDWFNVQWRVPMNLASAFDALFMLGGGSAANFDTTAWSLVHEMRISIFFPVLVGIVLWRGARWSLILSFALAFLTRFLPPSNWLDTVYYVPLFVVGVALAQHQARIGDWLGRRSRLIVVGFGIVGLLAYLFRWLFAVDVPLLSNGPLFDWTAATGAMVFLVLAIHHAPTARVLSRAPLRWLGQVSYSLYLIHPVVLLALVHILSGVLPLVVIVGLVPVVSLLAAHLTWHAVEVPSMNLGRRFTRSQGGSATQTSSMPSPPESPPMFAGRGR